MCLALYSYSLPTAAVITGHAPALGAMIAVCSNYRVMQQGKFTIGDNEAKFDLVPNFFFADAFTHCIGQRNSELACMLEKMVTLRFVPFHFVPGHFVPVNSSPGHFVPGHFVPWSSRPLVISSPFVT
jgi:hypothetical protein